MIHSKDRITMTTSLHMFKTDKLRDDFQVLLEINREIVQKKKEISEKLQHLRTIYNGLIKKNGKKIFLFCLDSFFFQYKILTMEMDNITRYMNMINNRMYGEYYKLFNIIAMETSENYEEIKALAGEVAKKYPPYKDLDPLHEYDIQATAGIHSDILSAIDCLFRNYAAKEQNIHGYSDNSRIGISIVNFIHTLEYENTLLREQVSLYINYISFYHSSQSTYLKKLCLKIQNFQMEIEDEIMINHQSVQPLQDVNSTSAPVDMTSFFTIDFFDASASTGTTAEHDEISLHQEKEVLLSLSETLVQHVEQTMDNNIRVTMEQGQGDGGDEEDEGGQDI
jgi:hypothetical protein